MLNPLPFDTLKWVGTGKIYPTNPKDVPWELTAYLAQQLEIPEDFETAAFPDPVLQVQDFLELKLLNASFSLVHKQPDRCFSSHITNQDTIHLLTRPIPDRAFVEGLKK